MQWTGNLRVHLAFEILGYLAGAAVYVISRIRRGDVVPDRDRATVLTRAALGAAMRPRSSRRRSIPHLPRFVLALPFRGRLSQTRSAANCPRHERDSMGLSGGLALLCAGPYQCRPQRVPTFSTTPSSRSARRVIARL